MVDATFTLTFVVDGDRDEQWPIYRWGGVEIRDYHTYSWRGVKFLAETAANPQTGGLVSELPHTVVQLDAMAFGPFFDDWPAECEWYASQRPGLLLGLFVLPDGRMFAEIWTGVVELTQLKTGNAVNGVPQALLAQRRAVTLQLNGDGSLRLTAKIVGPVGHVTELVLEPDQTTGLDRAVWGELEDIL